MQIKKKCSSIRSRKSYYKSKVIPFGVFNDEIAKKILVSLRNALEEKHMQDWELFKQMDLDEDGFINLDEWCKGIDSLIPLTPSVKEKFFNYIDQEKLGMIDLKAFLKVFRRNIQIRLKLMEKDNFYWQIDVLKKIK